MFRRTDDIWLNVFLGLGLPALTAIFITGMTIGSSPVYLLFAIAAISLVSFVIIRRKKKHTHKE